MSVNTKHYKSSDYQFLRHESCPVCGSSNNVGVWLHKPTNKETKWCFTDGCTNNLTTQQIGAKEQPGSPLPQEWLDVLRISPRTAAKYRMTHTGKVLYFGYATSQGKLSRVKKRDYNLPKEHDYHFSWLTKEGETTLFYGMDSCTNSEKKLLIVSGELDAPCAYEMTGINTVSIPNGDGGVESVIRDNFVWLKQFKVIYICFDNDEPGQRAAEKAQAMIGYRSRIVSLPQYTIPLEDEVIKLKDARDYRKYSFDTEFTEALVAADKSVQPFVWAENELLARVQESYQSGNTRHYSTGIPELDQLCPIRLKELTIVFGAPGRGKSSLGRFMMKKMLEQGIKSYYMSFEEPPENVVYRLSPLLLGEYIYYDNEGSVSNPLDDVLDKTRRIGSMVRIAKLESVDPDELYDSIECAYVTHGCQFILLDHITWLLDSAGNPVQTARVIMHKLCDLVTRYPIHIYCVAHNQAQSRPQASTKTPTKKDWEEYEEPTQRDVQWSSGFEQMAYNIWGLKNPDDPDQPMRIYVLKNRFGGKKKCGKVFAYYQDDGSFLGATDAAKKSKGSHRNRGDNTQVRQQTRDAVAEEVLPADTEVPKNIHSVPEEVGEAEQHSGAFQSRSSKTTGVDVGADDGVFEEVPKVRLQPGLYNKARSNYRSKGENAGQLPNPGEDVLGTAPSIFQTLQNCIPEPNTRGSKKKAKLPGLGRRTGDTVVPSATTRTAQSAGDTPTLAEPEPNDDE